MNNNSIAMIAFHTCPAAFEEGLEIGGMNSYVWELSSALSQLGLHVDIFTRCHDANLPRQRAISPQMNLIHLPAGPPVPLSVPYQGHQYIDEFVEHFWQFCVKEQCHYRILHGHYYLSGLIAMKYNQKAQKHIPIVMNFHTLGLAKTFNSDNVPEERIKIEKYLMAHVQQVVANCSLDKQHLCDLYGLDPKKVTIIPPGINLSVFGNQDKICQNTDKMKLLFVGRTDAAKGLQELLLTLKLLEQSVPERFILTIVTSDPQSMLEMAIMLDMPKLPSVLTQRSPHDLAQCYSEADLLILPSHYESFGMVALEAMACGTAAMVTRQSGISDLISLHHPAWVVADNAPPTMATALLYLSENPQLLQPAVNIEDYEWSKKALSWDELYSYYS